MFKPGDVVECIEAGLLQVRPPSKGAPLGLVLGALYTVAGVYPKGTPRRGPDPVWRIDHVDLREVRHPHAFGAYAARRFRLLKRKDPDLLERLMRAPAPVI